MTNIIDKMVSEIKVTPLLGVQDFNRTSTLVKIGGKNVLLDCGLKMDPPEILDGSKNQNNGDNDSLLPNFSFLIGSEAAHITIDCVIISHYHLDHSGSLPYLTEMVGYKGPIVMTQPTKTIAPFVWRDCHKNLQERNFFPDFLTSSRINECLSKVTTVVYSQSITIDHDISITVYPSNQPLGPDIFHLQVGPQTIVYTGGCNLKPRPSLFYNSPRSKAKDTPSRAIDTLVSPATDQNGELTVKMNGCMLSFKVGHSSFHRQLSLEEMKLVSAVFNNLQFMVDTEEDEFWQRIAYEMAAFSSPLNEHSRYKWKSLFYDSHRSCGQISNENDDSVSMHELSQEIGAIGNSIHSSGGKKKRKGKKAEAKNKRFTLAGDLIKFESPDKATQKPRNGSGQSNSSPIPYSPDPDILDDQNLLISLFAERLKFSQITTEFWTDLSRDLKRKGKKSKSVAFLEEYFRKLSNIQFEVMKTSENALQAREKWPHFDLLNDIDLSYFFKDKWAYRNLKKFFHIDSTTPNKVAKGKKQKQKPSKPHELVNSHEHRNHHQTTSPAIKSKSSEKHHKYQPRQQHSQQQKEKAEDEAEPQPIIHYATPPEDLADQLITITLFTNRLKQTEISPEFWKLLHKDFENIGKPIKPEVNLQDHYKKLAEIQLDVMKNADNMITAVSRWPLFMLLHNLPLDIFLDDKWTYRKLKSRFC